MTNKFYKALDVRVLNYVFLKSTAHDDTRLNTSNLKELREVMSTAKFRTLLNNIILAELFSAPALSPYDWSVDTLTRDVVRMKSTDRSFVYKIGSLLPATAINCLLTEFHEDYFYEAINIYCRIVDSKILEPQFVLGTIKDEQISSLSTFWVIQHNIVQFVDLIENQLINSKDFLEFLDKKGIKKIALEKGVRGIKWKNMRCDYGMV